MSQDTSSPSRADDSRAATVQVASLAWRSLGQLADINVAATRVLLQTNARAASALGWPDWSGVFDQADERARRLFSDGVEQLVDAARRANDAAAELQHQVGRVVETQTVTVAESLQQGLQELGNQASVGLNQLCEAAREQADEAERLAQSVTQQVKDSVREGGQQLRDMTRQGAGEFQGAMRREAESSARPATATQGEAPRDSALKSRPGTSTTVPSGS